MGDQENHRYEVCDAPPVRGALQEDLHGPPRRGHCGLQEHGGGEVRIACRILVSSLSQRLPLRSFPAFFLSATEVASNIARQMLVRASENARSALDYVLQQRRCCIAVFAGSLQLCFFSPHCAPSESTYSLRRAAMRPLYKTKKYRKKK